ncbi:hypothetical protein KXS07_02290 [Inquilinus limosus]|uniref:hypothetical protein n=1 Tax=Inquilinus limosus TaxID=171674 RepID=UPI003F13BFEF
MKKPVPKAGPKRRDPHALIARRLGHKIVPSGKVYSRKDKHRSPRHPDGGFAVSRVTQDTSSVGRAG